MKDRINRNAQDFVELSDINDTDDKERQHIPDFSVYARFPTVRTKRDPEENPYKKIHELHNLQSVFCSIQFT